MGRVPKTIPFVDISLFDISASGQVVPKMRHSIDTGYLLDSVKNVAFGYATGQTKEIENIKIVEAWLRGDISDDELKEWIHI